MVIVFLINVNQCIFIARNESNTMISKTFQLYDGTSIVVDVLDNVDGHKHVRVVHANDFSAIDKVLLVFAPEEMKIEIIKIGSYSKSVVAPILSYIDDLSK
jgi:hypothetical protein